MCAAFETFIPSIPTLRGRGGEDETRTTSRYNRISSVNRRTEKKVKRRKVKRSNAVECEGISAVSMWIVLGCVVDLFYPNPPGPGPGAPAQE